MTDNACVQIFLKDSKLCLCFGLGVRIGMWPWQQTVALLDWTKEELQNLQSKLRCVEERLQKQALEVKTQSIAIIFGVHST